MPDDAKQRFDKLLKAMVKGEPPKGRKTPEGKPRGSAQNKSSSSSGAPTNS
jgi:hypothetical protein